MITRFTFWISLASFALVAGCATPKPNSEQLDQLMRRTSILEQRVHDLEVTNAELQMQVRMLQQQPSPQMPRWSPSPIPPPPGTEPPKNQTPHLTPLDGK